MTLGTKTSYFSTPGRPKKLRDLSSALQYMSYVHRHNAHLCSTLTWTRARAKMCTTSVLCTDIETTNVINCDIDNDGGVMWISKQCMCLSVSSRFPQGVASPLTSPYFFRGVVQGWWMALRGLACHPQCGRAVDGSFLCEVFEVVAATK
jgi:hypothetical protein